MAPLARSGRDIWHRRLITSGAYQCIVDGPSSDLFPLRSLRPATDAVLAKKNLLPQSPQCEAKLLELIAEHVAKEGGAREVAILACLHALSVPAAFDILRAFRDECYAARDNNRFLRCFIMVSHLDMRLSIDGEFRAAEAMQDMLDGHETFKAIQALIRALGTVPEPYFVPPNYVNEVLRVTDFGKKFKRWTDELRTSRRYMTLHKATRWLADLPALPAAATAIAVAEVQIPLWRVWVTWSPNSTRLAQWHGGNLTTPQKQRLFRLFDLEGPDTSGQGYGSLKEAVPKCFEHINLEPKDLGLLERLLQILDQAQTLPGTSAVDLFIFLCVENESPVDENVLCLAETILATEDEKCIEAMRAWLASLTPGSGFSNKMVALTKILPVFPNHSQLAGLGDEVLADVEDVMRTAQLEYCIQLDVGIAENFGMRIHDFGAAILSAEWAHESLSEEFLINIEKFPEEETLRRLFEFFESSTHSSDPFREYLAVTLGGKDGDAEQMLAAIDADISFWSSVSDSKRFSLAMAIKKLPCVPTELYETCKMQMVREDDQLLQDLLPIVSGIAQASTCVDVAQILARRRRLPSCSVHECWVSLLACLVDHAADNILAWSAETLPTSNWFQWLADLQLLLPRNEKLSEVGFTKERFEWWQLLRTQYASSIGRLETLQRGQGNLKWLYLEEIESSEVLLSLLRNSSQPTPMQKWMLAYFSAVPEVIRQLCVTLVSIERLSPQGTRAFHSLLQRNSQSRSVWPKEATETMLVGWGQARGLTEADKDALAGLAKLMRLSPNLDFSGFRAVRDILVSEYSDVLDVARSLESQRVTLRFHDARRTTALLDSLNVEDAKGFSDPDIPDDLSDAIERIGDHTYELAFPLTQLKTHQRLAACIPEDARMLLVRVTMVKKPGFCIHFHPGDKADVASHTYWYATGSPPPGPVCSAKANLFSHLLGGALSWFLKDGGHDLRSIYNKVSATIQAPAANCQSCAKPLGAKVWRPTTCSDGCAAALQRAPLEVRAANFLVDGPVLDLLLCTLYAAAGDPSSLDLIPGCPVPKAQLRGVIDTFPALPREATAAEILSAATSSSSGQSREKLLSWMCVTFRGWLISAPQGARVPSLPGVTQFLLVNSPPEREKAFAAYQQNNSAAATASSSAAATAAVAPAGGPALGGVVFHGTTPARLWKVLTEGLKNMTSSPFMLHGGSHGAGIYLADEASMAMGYSGSTGSIGAAGCWKHTAFANATVLLGAELAGHTPANYHVVPDESRVLVRYVFLCPAGFRPPEARLVAGAMRMTYGALRTGLA